MGKIYSEKGMPDCRCKQGSETRDNLREIQKLLTNIDFTRTEKKLTLNLDVINRHVVYLMVQQNIPAHIVRTSECLKGFM